MVQRSKAPGLTVFFQFYVETKKPSSLSLRRSKHISVSVKIGLVLCQMKWLSSCWKIISNLRRQRRIVEGRAATQHSGTGPISRAWSYWKLWDRAASFQQLCVRMLGLCLNAYSAARLWPICSQHIFSVFSQKRSLYFRILLLPFEPRVGVASCPLAQVKEISLSCMYGSMLAISFISRTFMLSIQRRGMDSRGLLLWTAW